MSREMKQRTPIGGKVGVVSVRIPEEDRRRLERAALDRNTFASEILRVALEEWMERNEPGTG